MVHRSKYVLGSFKVWMINHVKEEEIYYYIVISLWRIFLILQVKLKGPSIKFLQSLTLSIINYTKEQETI